MVKGKEILAICPYFKCQKIIFRRARAYIDTDQEHLFELEMICPHCHNLVQIKVDLKVNTSPIKI